jgi:hypothetical protein
MQNKFFATKNATFVRSCDRNTILDAESKIAGNFDRERTGLAKSERGRLLLTILGDYDICWGFGCLDDNAWS